MRPRYESGPDAADREKAVKKGQESRGRERVEVKRGEKGSRGEKEGEKGSGVVWRVKRGQESFAGTAQRVLRTNDS